MSDENKGTERVTFSRGFDVHIIATDETWRSDCRLNAFSDTDAILTVEGSIQGLNLKEFFLLLSSTGLAYRRCELVRVNGAEMNVQFLLGKHKKKGPGTPQNHEPLMASASRERVAEYIPPIGSAIIRCRPQPARPTRQRSLSAKPSAVQ